MNKSMDDLIDIWKNHISIMEYICEKYSMLDNSKVEYIINEILMEDNNE